MPTARRPSRFRLPADVRPSAYDLHLEPDQAFGDYYRGRSASCALGAAYEGMYRLPTQAGGLRPTKDLEWFFDCLEGSVRKCPHGDDCKKTLSLAAIMVHLNDDHKWSREQIAQWLESLK